MTTGTELTQEQIDAYNAKAEIDGQKARLSRFGYPPALQKACMDQFAYCIQLRNGDVIKFSRAEAISDEWVRIFGTESFGHNGEESAFLGLAHPYPRGIEISMAEIVWIADAPDGS